MSSCRLLVLQASDVVGYKYDIKKTAQDPKPLQPATTTITMRLDTMTALQQGRSAVTTTACVILVVLALSVSALVPNGATNGPQSPLTAAATTDVCQPAAPAAVLTSSTMTAGVVSRRQWVANAAAATAASAAFWTTAPQSAAAAQADCYTDCLKNCKILAPQDAGYCQDTCTDYCAQPDRTDGLSGSVSAAAGEVGILGGTFGQGTVTKGKDKPPVVNLPGLDFSSEKGKNLIGY